MHRRVELGLSPPEFCRKISSGSGRTMRSKKKRVLCVEDEPDTCEMFSLILSDYDVVAVATKAEAVRMAKLGGFKLILMDYYLPDGTGAEACDLIRVFDKITPILFVTGSGSFTETLARAVGAQGTLRKARPTFIEELQSRAMQLSLA